MPDSEHVPNKPGKKNWVEKTGGLPEYINRIAKDLMDKGMTESHAIATAVNTVKKWARGGGGVTPKTRAKAAAALAEWESKKAASHVGLSTPTRLERTRHARLRSMDLAAVLDRASSIADPETRDRTTYRLLDLAGTQALTPKSYNIDRVRDAYSGMQSKKRQAFYARQAKQRQAAGTLGSPMIDSPSSGPAYRYVKEVWNTHLIVKDDNNGLFKVPYTVGNSGADISFGNEVPVTEQYVELSDPADGWLADLDDRGNVTALAGEVFDLAFGQAESSGTATTSAALKTAYTARDAKAAKAVARKRAAGSRKTKRRARKGSTLHATQVRVGAKMRAMAAAEAHPGQPVSKAIRDAVKVHQAQERVQARTEATGSGTGGAKWAHGWVPLNDAAKKQVAANPEKFKQMRKKQKKQAKSVSLSAALERAALIEDPAAKVAARLAILDLAKPGQRYRHGWIRIDGVPVGKSRPKVAGSRGLKVDGLTKEQHSARVDRIAAIPRTERTRKQQDQFVRSNAVLRGEAVPARSLAPVGAEAAASQAATSAGIDARKARKGLPTGQTPGSTGGMTDAAATHPHNALIAATKDLINSSAGAKKKQHEKQFDLLHTQRGQALWPGLSPEAARHRSVQDHQYRTGAVSVGPNWERPSWYTGPAPKVSGPQGTQNRVAPGPGRAPHVNPPIKAAGPPLSRRQTSAELNAKDRKAADRLIAEMPKMSEDHLKIAANSPSTSQKVKDAAGAELATRGISYTKTAPDAPDKPWSQIPADYKTIRNGQRWVMAMGPNGTELRPYRDPAKASTLWRAVGQKVQTEFGPGTVEQSSDRRVFIKLDNGQSINVATGTPGYDRLKKANAPSASIAPAKIDPAKLGGVSTEDLQSVVRTGNWGGTPVHPDSMPKIEAEIARRASGATPGAHPEKFKPGEKPPVHKFMNTQRLQAIANGDHPEHAATAKEILAKRGKSAGVPQAPSPAGLSSSNDAARGMTERILAKREAKQRDTSSADITAARAAAGTPDTNVGNARLARVSTSTLQNWQRSGTPSQKVMAAQELRRREQPMRGGSVPPPRPIGGARGMGSAQTGSSNAEFARQQVAFMRDAARKSVAELNDMSSADLAKIAASSFAPRNLKTRVATILNRRRNASQ